MLQHELTASPHASAAASASGPPAARSTRRNWQSPASSISASCSQARAASALQVVRRGAQQPPAAADAPGHQGALGRGHVAHGEVGVAAQQVFGAVAQREFEVDPRMGRVEAGEHRRQHHAA